MVTVDWSLWQEQMVRWMWTRATGFADLGAAASPATTSVRPNTSVIAALQDLAAGRTPDDVALWSAKRRGLADRWGRLTPAGRHVLNQQRER